MKILSIIILTVFTIIPLTTNGDEKLQKISGILDKTNKNKSLLKINKNFSIEARGEKVKEIPDGSIIIATGTALLDFEEINDDKKSGNWEPPLLNFTPYFIVKKYKVLEANETNKARWEKRNKRHVVKHLLISGAQEKAIKSVSICNKDFNVSILFIGDNPDVFGGYLGVTGSNAPGTIPKHEFDDLKYYLTPEKKRHKVSIRVNDDFSHELKDYKIIYSEMAEQRNEIEVDTDLVKLWKIIAARSERYKIDGIKVENYWKQKLAEMPKAEKEFVEKFVSAYIKNDTDAMMKLIHPKCIALYKSKNASQKLLKLAMNSSGFKVNLGLKLAKITPETDIPASKEKLEMDQFLIYPVKTTHSIWLVFKQGLNMGKGLVYENGKFYLAIPYIKKGFAEYMRKKWEKSTKDIKSNKVP